MTKNYNSDYDELLKVGPLRLPVKKQTEQNITESIKLEKNVSDLEKKVEKLEKILYTLKSVVDKQLKTIRVLTHNQNQERANGHNSRPQTSSK